MSGLGGPQHGPRSIRRLAALAAALVIGAASASPVAAVDTTPPTATVTPSVTATTGSTIVFWVAFSETVTGLTASDLSASYTITASGCAIGTPGWSAIRNAYNVTLTGCTATTTGTVSLTLAKNAVLDVASNPGPVAAVVSAAVTIDHLSPTVGTPSISPSTTVAGSTSITITAALSDAVPIAGAELSVAGGIWLSMSAQDGTFNSAIETATATTTAPAPSYVQQPYSVCVRATDSLGNATASPTCTTLTVTDTVPPNVALVPVSLPLGTDSSTITYTVGFPETVTGLAKGDFVFVSTGAHPATGCATGTLTGSGAFYTITVTGCSAGTVTLGLGSNTVTDAHANSGPVSLTKAEPLEHDTQVPGWVSLAAPTTLLQGHATTASADVTDDLRIYRGLVQIDGGNWEHAAITPHGSYGDVTVSTVIGAATKVATGKYHACALIVDGTVRCWGANTIGQANPASPDWFVPTPTLVEGITDAVAISAGYAATCALLRDHTVRCWGYAPYLGGTPLGGAAGPAEVAGITTATRVDVGSHSACAVLAGGGVDCWGFNGNGEIGDGTTTSAATPQPVAGITTAVDVAVGSATACAALADGTVRCWGANYSGETGKGSVSASEPLPVPVPGISSATAVAVGAGYACALLANMESMCWGGMGAGQLGTGLFSATTLAPAKTAFQASVQLAAGDTHLCARSMYGWVDCAGTNVQGELGRGAVTTVEPLAGQVVGLSAADDLAADAQYTCAVETGGVMCWGSDMSGQLGDGSEAAALRVHTTHDLGSPTAVAMAGGAMCEVLASRILKCWGTNSDGRVGNGTTNDTATPTIVGTLSTVTGISIGAHHACALLVDRVGRCWGLGTGGQLGNGANGSSTVPVHVSGLVTATQIVVGDYHSCAVLADAMVSCWGNNGLGQLGLGQGTSTVNTPTEIPLMTPVESLAANGNSTCAVIGGGLVFCWGANSGGQLGNSTKTTAFTPVEVQGLTQAQKVVLGYRFGCAMTWSGTVSCWGSNGMGQLGDGTTTDHLTAQAVPNLTGVTDIAAGSYGTCVVATGPVVKCWGMSFGGIRGDGTTTSASSPVTVPDTTGAVAVWSGGDAYCASMADGSLRCWGSDYHGELQTWTNTTDGVLTPMRDGSRSLPDNVPGLPRAAWGAGSHTVCLAAVDTAGNNVTTGLTPGANCFTVNVPADVTPPVATVTRPHSPNGAPTLTYLLTFDEPVQNLVPGDLALDGSTATGCVVASVTGSGTEWTAKVGGCSEGTVQLTLLSGSIMDMAGNPGPATSAAALPVVVERMPPTATAPASVLLASGRALAPGGAVVRLTWHGSDNTAIDHYELRSSTDGGATWTVVYSSVDVATADVAAPVTGTIRYCVVAFDTAGNSSACVAGPVRTYRLVQQTSTAVKWAGTWKVATAAAWSGGSAKYATAAGASATFTFTGRTVALVSTRALTRGKVRIYQGSTLLATVDLKAASTTYRSVVWQKTWTTVATRTIRVVALGTAGRPRVDVDAFLTIK